MSTEIKLTSFSKGAGCGCKIAPTVLQEILKSNIVSIPSEKILVGNEANDDAAVYDLGDGNALISSTDFFMPIVAVLYHRQLKLIYKKYEHGVFLVLKLLCFVSYLIVMISAYILQSSILKFTNQIIFIVIGSLTIIYSYGIFHIKIFSYSS